MLLHITHSTRYAYAPAVEWAQHVAHLKPRAFAGQRLIEHQLEVLPRPAQMRERVDLYGNTGSFFALQSSHGELEVTATSIVETSAPPAAGGDLPWEQVRERYRYRAGAPFDAAAEFVFASPHVPRHLDFGDYARPSFGPGRGLLEACADLMGRIHADFEYLPDSTEVDTPVLDALHGRRGVCQDFAHLMLACLRELGLPARYVSGYLLTEPPPGQPRLIGADASHAWASVYLPADAGAPDDAGHWIDLDPTNNRHGADDYVTLAWGRDYADVSPLRGILHGGARHHLAVEVTVQPLPRDNLQPGSSTES